MKKKDSKEIYEYKPTVNELEFRTAMNIQIRAIEIAGALGNVLRLCEINDSDLLGKHGFKGFTKNYRQIEIKELTGDTLTMLISLKNGAKEITELVENIFAKEIMSSYSFGYEFARFVKQQNE